MDCREWDQSLTFNRIEQSIPARLPFPPPTAEQEQTEVKGYIAKVTYLIFFIQTSDQDLLQWGQELQHLVQYGYVMPLHARKGKEGMFF